MTIFDLLFIIVVFAAVVTLVVALATVLRGRLKQAVRVLAIYGVCAALYLGAVVAVSLASPQRVWALGEDRCYDDWCIAVDDVARSALPTGVEYTVILRVSQSSSQGASTREWRGCLRDG